MHKVSGNIKKTTEVLKMSPQEQAAYQEIKIELTDKQKRSGKIISENQKANNRG